MFSYIYSWFCFMEQSIMSVLACSRPRYPNTKVNITLLLIERNRVFYSSARDFHITKLTNKPVIGNKRNLSSLILPSLIIRYH